MDHTEELNRNTAKIRRLIMDHPLPEEKLPEK